MTIIKKTIKSLIPHVLVILSGIFVVLLILDGYNPTMNFINNNISIKLLWTFSIIVLVNSIINILGNRKEWRR